MSQLSQPHHALYLLRTSLRPRSNPSAFAKWLKAVIVAKIVPLREFYAESGLSPAELQTIIKNKKDSTKGMRRDAYEAASYLMDRYKPNAAPSNSITNRRQTSVYFTGADGEHEGQCLNILRDAIDAAELVVRVMAYWLTSSLLLDAFNAAAKRGVLVGIIYDPTGHKPKKSHPGVIAIPDTINARAHNKIIIIDDKMVFTGSFNFTAWADHHNAENLLEIRDPAIVQPYVAYWQSTHQRLLRAQKISKRQERSRTCD